MLRTQKVRNMAAADQVTHRGGTGRRELGLRFARGLGFRLNARGLKCSERLLCGLKGDVRLLEQPLDAGDGLGLHGYFSQLSWAWPKS